MVFDSKISGSVFVLMQQQFDGLVCFRGCLKIPELVVGYVHRGLKVLVF